VILLTGATGYIGSQLLARLERDGRPVRALSRTPERLLGTAAPTTEVVRGDVADAASLAPAFEGVEAAFYLVHSLGSDADFAERDRAAALTFAAAARAAGVGRIVYLGGLGSGDDLSPHLASRHEVGEILRASGVPAIEFRASVVLGEGSASYDLLEFVIEKLPAAFVPDWVNRPSQPIAVDDVIEYLAAALDVPLEQSRVYEIGGPEPLSYLALMRSYARLRGLRRAFVTVPAFVPLGADLFQRALESVAPERVALWLRLIESLRNETSVRDDAALRDFDVVPRPVDAALNAALSDAAA
jgi:uncharacterized protein YbjT (DUF2867 family)